MMSHSLMETWKNRNGNTLTVQGYLDSGGVSGAIAQTAETVFRNFTKDKKIIAKNIFLRLTEIGDGVEATSRRADLDELGSDAGQEKYTKEVLKDLADARLIITSQESAELAHEAIFEKWPTMRAWLERRSRKFANSPSFNPGGSPMGEGWA